MPENKPAKEIKKGFRELSISLPMVLLNHVNFKLKKTRLVDFYQKYMPREDFKKYKWFNIFVDRKGGLVILPHVERISFSKDEKSRPLPELLKVKLAFVGVPPNARLQIIPKNKQVDKIDQARIEALQLKQECFDSSMFNIMSVAYEAHSHKTLQDLRSSQEFGDNIDLTIKDYLKEKWIKDDAKPKGVFQHVKFFLKAVVGFIKYLCMSDETRELINVLKPGLLESPKKNITIKESKTENGVPKNERKIMIAENKSNIHRYAAAKQYILQNRNHTFAKVLLRNNKNLRNDMGVELERELNPLFYMGFRPK